VTCSVVTSVLLSGIVVLVIVGIPVVVCGVVLLFDDTGVVDASDASLAVVEASFVVVGISVVVSATSASVAFVCVVTEWVVGVVVVVWSEIFVVTDSDDGACVSCVVVFSSAVVLWGASLPDVDGCVVFGIEVDTSISCVVLWRVVDSGVSSGVVTGMVVACVVSRFSVGSWVMRCVVSDGFWVVVVGGVTEDRVVTLSIVVVVVLAGSVLNTLRAIKCRFYKKI
jgi:hypothetical protein